MLTTLSKSGTGYSYATCRLYDAWGGIRSGPTTGSPSGRHCANLGHVQDDESGLLYMRARYYEAGSGRFANEDPDCHGLNYFTYCRNDPINQVDASGRESFGVGIISAIIKRWMRGLGIEWKDIGPGTKFFIKLCEYIDAIINCLTLIGIGGIMFAVGEGMVDFSGGNPLTTGIGGTLMAMGCITMLIGAATIAMTLYNMSIDFYLLATDGDCKE